MRRVALIGAGFIARVHAEALQSLRGVQVSAVVDPKRDAAASLARTCEAAQVFTSIDDALAADAFDCATSWCRRPRIATWPCRCCKPASRC